MSDDQNPDESNDASSAQSSVEDQPDMVENHSNPEEISEVEASAGDSSPETEEKKELSPKEELIEKIGKRFNFFNTTLKDKEELMLAPLEYDINHAYYILWRTESNEIIRRLAVFRRRMRRIQSGQKSY